MINPAIASLSCGSPTHNGSLTAGTAASGVSTVIGYTGGDGSAYAGQSISSTGVTGLVATLSAGSFASGAGSVTYTITGTPSQGGTATFSVIIGGRSCSFSRTVGASIPIASSITLSQSRSYMVASVYDQDYLPYTSPTGSASLIAQNADGVNESTTINIQGTITTSGVTVQIPVTVSGTGTLPAYSTTISIPAASTEDGISRNLTLSWPVTPYTTGTTSITATIVADNTLNVKKLDINSGIGNDNKGILLGTFNYPYNATGNVTTFEVRAISGIPDRMFGQADNGGVVRHNFLYLPVTAADGSVWLNNNLGAYYSDTQSTYFNMSQQATGATDFKAYGSLFQWGRKPDGHELITWSSGSSGSPINSTTGTLSDAPTTALFIINGNGNLDWRVNGSNGLWRGVSAPNNPCPYGFRLPTNDEWSAIVDIENIFSNTSAASSVLKLTASGFRYYNNGSLANVGSSGSYWSSSVTGTNAFYRLFDSVSTYMTNYSRASGYAVRCLKD